MHGGTGPQWGLLGSVTPGPHLADIDTPSVTGMTVSLAAQGTRAPFLPDQGSQTL